LKGVRILRGEIFVGFLITGIAFYFSKCYTLYVIDIAEDVREKIASSFKKLSKNLISPTGKKVLTTFA